MTDDKLSLLKTHSCAQGLSEEVLREIAEAAEAVHCDTGVYLRHAHEPFTSICIVIHGRLQLSLVDDFGNLVMQRQQHAGGQIGAIGAALGGSAARVSR